MTHAAGSSAIPIIAGLLFGWIAAATESLSALFK